MKIINVRWIKFFKISKNKGLQKSVLRIDYQLEKSGKIPTESKNLRGVRKYRLWANGDVGRNFKQRKKRGKACVLRGWWAKGSSRREDSNRPWVKVMEGLNPNWRVFMMKETYLQIILPRDLLWQGLICREQAIAFHISGWHFLMSRTGMLINGIFMLPFSHSFMSFMAPWSDWALQLLKSSVGLKRKKGQMGSRGNYFIERSDG